MGNCPSGNSSARSSQNTVRRELGIRDVDRIMANEDGGGELSERMLDDMEVARLRKELEENPEEFVLNNLLMSIMFFENYERERQKFQKPNTNRAQNQSNESVIPDVVLETVHKNVRYRRLHGPTKNTVEPLVPRRIFVVNDNIEVLDSQDNNQYSAIDKPAYLVLTEESKHSGFCKLRCAPNQLRKIVATDASKEPTPGPSSKPDDSEVYEYSTIASINTPKLLEITSCERRDTLPQSCFVSREIKKYADKNDEGEEVARDSKPEEKTEFFQTVSYISSKGFMTYFQNAVFPNALGSALGFDSSAISLARAIPGTIFCNLKGVQGFSELPCEIVPSVEIQWPIDSTWEFHSRSERPTMWDKFGHEYRWPKNTMVNDIRGLSCVLIPKGFIPKRDANPDSDIEWEIGFPKAQRYLDTHMSHTQSRTFLYLLILYKTYIESANRKYDGLLMDHIRTHIYWEIESNPRDWAAHKLGTRLILIMQRFNQKLARRQLPHFFIKKKNTFENVPNKYLTHAQKIFHDILESPVVYFIGALRNLIYTNPKFYPQVDFSRLYDIITTTDTLKLVNSNNPVRPPNLFPKTRAPVRVQGNIEYQKDKEWEKKKELENRKKVLEKIRKQNEKEENLKTQRRGSVDSIDYGWQSEKNFEVIKTRQILLFFIRHFIEMAKTSRTLATPRQALFYLKQAYYLTRLLDIIGLKEDARNLYEEIGKEETTSKKLSVTESLTHPPITPKRNSTQFNWELTQQVKGSNVNLNNLNNSYNNSTIPVPSFKLKKHPSNLKSRSNVLRNEERDAAVRRSVVEFSDVIETR